MSYINKKVRDFQHGNTYVIISYDDKWVNLADEGNLTEIVNKVSKGIFLTLFEIIDN